MTTELIVAFNLTDPLARLAFAPTCALADATGVRLRWRPLRTSSLSAPVKPDGDGDRGSWHRYHRARNRDRDLLRYAAVQGIDLGDLYRQVDGTVSAYALLWLAEHGGDVRTWLDQVLDDFFSGAVDVESKSAVAATLPAGMQADFEAWAASDGPSALDAAEQNLRDAGLHAVPGYLVDEEPFIGRAHLPMLSWIIGGRAGPPPI